MTPEQIYGIAICAFIFTCIIAIAIIGALTNQILRRALDRHADTRIFRFVEEARRDFS